MEKMYSKLVKKHLSNILTASLLTVLFLMAIFVPITAMANQEEVVIDLANLTSDTSGANWSFKGSDNDSDGVNDFFRLAIFCNDGGLVFRIKGDGLPKQMDISLRGEIENHEYTFNGIIVFENLNINSKSATVDFANSDTIGSTATIKLIGDNRIESANHAGININKGTLTIEAYDEVSSSLMVIGGGSANGIGTGEDWDEGVDTLSEKPFVSIGGNCTVTAQGTQEGNALGAQSLKVDGGATLILQNQSNSLKEIDERTVVNVSDGFIGGSTVGNIAVYASPSTVDFGVQPVYAAPPHGQIVTILNRGLNSISLEQPASANYTIGALSKNDLHKADTATFTVQPNPGLPVGSYNETIIVRDSSNVLNIAVPVRFEVTEPSNQGGADQTSSSDYRIIPVTTIKQPDVPTIAKLDVSGAAKDGILTATITEKIVDNAIKAAQQSAKKAGKQANGIALDFYVAGNGSYAGLDAIIDLAAVGLMSKSNVEYIKIGSAVLGVTFDSAGIAILHKQANEMVVISARQLTELKGEAKQLIGNRPVLDIVLTTVKEGKTVSITNLGTGTATLSIPTTPAKNEAAGALYAVYVDDKDRITRIEDSFYDATSGSVIFNTNHFSIYGVGATTPAVKVMDIATHWAKESIDYVLGRGLLGSNAQGKFNPNAAITRGELVTALGKLAGINPKAYTKNSFADVKENGGQMPYIAWASSKGILKGITSSQFAPEKTVTRQEIALILQNYSKATSYTLPVTRTAFTFMDNSKIGSDYRTAVKALQQAGIVMGERNNKFNPASNITRAEVSAALHRYIKLTIAPATAQGWARNDDGQFQYYKDGKAIIGTQIIDGVQYFFHPNGTLKTGWVQEGSNWRYYYGNTMVVGWRNISTKGVIKRYYFDAKGNRVSGKWLEIGGIKYCFEADGALARSAGNDS